MSRLPTVQEAGPAHAAVIADLHRACFPRPWSELDMARTLAMPGSLALIAVFGTSPCGFLLCRAAADEAEVISVAILPEWRRRGVAGQLLDSAAGCLRDSGVTALYLEVAPDNAAACALYAAYGFEEVGRRPGYYPQGDGPSSTALILRAYL